MGGCGGCGCGKHEKKIFKATEFVPLPDSYEWFVSKLLAVMGRVSVAGRDVNKLCPRCEHEYLLGGFMKGESSGIDNTHCTRCGMKEVLAFKPKCWCGMTISPRDKYCGYHGHPICECSLFGVVCPGWHDFSDRFVE